MDAKESLTAGGMREVHSLARLAIMLCDDYI